MVLVFVCGKGYNRQEVTGPVWTKGNGRGKGRRGEGEQRVAITGGWEHGKWSREDRKVLAFDNTMSGQKRVGRGRQEGLCHPRLL